MRWCNELRLSPSVVVFSSHRGVEHLRLDSRLLVFSIDSLYLGLRLPPFRFSNHPSRLAPVIDGESSLLARIGLRGESTAIWMAGRIAVQVVPLFYVFLLSLRTRDLTVPHTDITRWFTKTENKNYCGYLLALSIHE